MSLSRMALTRPVNFGIVEPQDLRVFILLAGGALFLTLLGIFVTSSTFRPKNISNAVLIYLRFIYAIFLKPHQNTADGGQQSALESFYATQVGTEHAFESYLANVFRLPSMM